MNHAPPSLDCLFYELYATAVREPGTDEQLWERIAGGLAATLKLPLVMIGHYDKQGTISVLGTSRDCNLWIDMQRVPERWDGSVVGKSLAAMALEARRPVSLTLDDERFVCWQESARKDHLFSGWAVAVEVPPGPYLLQAFADTPGAFQDAGLAEQLDHARQRFARFIEDLAALREQRLLARALDHAGNAAFITDRDGTIEWCNQAFTRLYGYSREEAVGQNPRFLKSGRQGVRYYRELWSTIRAGKVWSGETVDRDRDGVAYTVRQTISPFALDDRPSHYLALHDDVSVERAARLRQELRTGIDPVSGLMTRAAFEAQLSGTESSPEHHWSLLLISLREFQAGVSALGQDLAESITAEIGKRIRGALTERDCAAVLAPGEYAVQAHHNGHDHTPELEQALRRALTQPVPHLAGTLKPAPQIAVARHPEDGIDFDTLIHHADHKLADQPMPRVRH